MDKRDNEFDLVLVKQFQLGTEYGSVLGYLKLLNENLHDLRGIMIGQTGVGKTFMSMAISPGLKNARGIVLSQPKKQDVMTFLKHCMEDGLVHIPYDREFMNELNLERFGLEATGRLKFSHPPGTHDERKWAFTRLHNIRGRTATKTPNVPWNGQYISAKKKPNHISMSRNHCNRLKPAHAISTGDPSSSKGS